GAGSGRGGVGDRRVLGAGGEAVRSGPGVGRPSHRRGGEVQRLPGAQRRVAGGGGRRRRRGDAEQAGAGGGLAVGIGDGDVVRSQRRQGRVDIDGDVGR